jgi:hypothetical protein
MDVNLVPAFDALGEGSPTLGAIIGDKTGHLIVPHQ